MHKCHYCQILPTNPANLNENNWIHTEMLARTSGREQTRSEYQMKGEESSQRDLRSLISTGNQSE